MSNSASKAVVGVFTYMDDLIEGIGKVRGEQLPFEVYSPVPNHAIDEACDLPRSPIRMITLIGALTGLIGGFALAILTSMDWPLRTSAKAIVSVPAFVVIGYECTILFGALATFKAMLWWCKIPNPLRKVGYDPRFSYDKFGLVVSCAPEQLEKVQGLLAASGADEVEVRDGL